MFGALPPLYIENQDYTYTIALLNLAHLIIYFTWTIFNETKC